MLALPPRRQSLHQQSHYYPQHLYIPQSQLPSQELPLQTQQQHWSSPPQAAHRATVSPQPLYSNTAALTNTIFSFGDEPLFDFRPQDFNSTPSQPLMQTEQSSNSWVSHGQLTPTSTTRAYHHRESSLSSLGSAGPASPYTANISNPQVAGDIYHDFQDFQQHQTPSKPLTPIHTPLQENFLAPPYTNFYQGSNLAYTMDHDTLSKHMGHAEFLPAPGLSTHSGRASLASVASHDSPSTPQAYEDEKHKSGEIFTVDSWLNDCLRVSDDEDYRAMPKLDRTMTDVYNDELYNPSFQITSASPALNSVTSTPLSPQNDIFSQRLKAANSQHLNASNTKAPLPIPARDRSPFRQGSPLAPTSNSFASRLPNARFGTATHMREQQKAENALALQQQLDRTSSGSITPKTISPKDVDLIYHESEEDSKTPLFPPSTQQQHQQPSPSYRQVPRISQELGEVDDSASHQSYGSMATSRRQSSSNYSSSPQNTPRANFNFSTPAVSGRQYPFIPQPHSQTGSISSASESFPPALVSMESSSSEFTPQSPQLRKPAGASADTGTYTCTYHGCTLRFDTPAKLQRHKREGHRNSASITSGADEGGMTSAALRNSQAGPHKCERINPSTGKPCNTIFSRPYDLTRHEDTIHNARKLKVHCPLCTEEKTFSRNDALTRHLRVVHPEHAELSKSRRRMHGHD